MSLLGIFGFSKMVAKQHTVHKIKKCKKVWAKLFDYISLNVRLQLKIRAQINNVADFPYLHSVNQPPAVNL